MAHTSFLATATIPNRILSGWSSARSLVEGKSASDQPVPSQRITLASLQHSLESAPTAQAESLDMAATPKALKRPPYVFGSWLGIRFQLLPSQCSSKGSISPPPRCAGGLGSY